MITVQLLVQETETGVMFNMLPKNTNPTKAELAFASIIDKGIRAAAHVAMEQGSGDSRLVEGCVGADITAQIAAIMAKAYPSKANELLENTLTKKQLILKTSCGTPSEFAQAVMKSVPGDISMDEAQKAIAEYGDTWERAGKS